MKVIANTIHGPMAVDDRDEFIGQRLLRDGHYSAEELALLTRHCEKDKDVLIVGAHLGALAIPLSRHCRRLVAVEANPDTYFLLTTNIHMNRCGNVTAVAGAASDKDGEVKFLCGTANSGGAKIMPKVMLSDYVYDNPSTTKVETFRLDDMVPGEYHLVHMDIEGSEVFAMRGAPKILSIASYLSIEFISHHLTHVAGVTVDEWLEPILAAGFNCMLVPGSTENNRPHVFIELADWREMLQNIVDAGAGVENLMFWRKS